MKISNNLIRLSMLTLAVSAMAGCFHSDSDDNNDGMEINNPPTAMSVDLITQTEVPISDKLSGSDPERDPIVFLLDQEPTMGTVTIDPNGNFTYQPFDEVTGVDMFTYIVRDVGGREVTATVGITIETLQVSFLDSSRQAFMADSSDDPMRVNGRAFTQDVASVGDYQDLIDNN